MHLAICKILSLYHIAVDSAGNQHIVNVRLIFQIRMTPSEFLHVIYDVVSPVVVKILDYLLSFF